MSYEKYREKVIEHFRKHSSILSYEEVEEYFEKEGNEILRKQYKIDIERFKNGEITENVLSIYIKTIIVCNACATGLKNYEKRWYRLVKADKQKRLFSNAC